MLHTSSDTVNGSSRIGAAAQGANGKQRAAMTVTNLARRFDLNDARAVYKLAAQSATAQSGDHPAQDNELSAKVNDALGVIEQAVDKFGLDRLALSFNGGKDCTVLVHLLAAVAVKRSIPQSQFLEEEEEPVMEAEQPVKPPTPLLPTLSSVYVRCLSPFPQVESFVNECSEWYNLELEAVEGGMRAALQEYLDKIEHKRRAQGRTDKIEAVLQLELTSFPFFRPSPAQLTAFDRTDKGWPDFMRVHPILDWSYAQIWDFLRHPQLTLGGGSLEWCELYDYGYTSLGSTHNTFPNPLLRSIEDGGAGVGGWRPAWELQDGSQERAGRERLADDVSRIQQQAVEPESGAANATI
ncbi:3'-phosphoadenosine 5'-phosphosulfate sulfotransferase [Microbotryomycetes sp. JL201]|nr:3'-phosphoadenosine 5'-phosphosulfate sulfotransferase [Microbotryomycetes sp. JL201]